MFRGKDGAWEVRDPFGKIVNITGSQSQGLQEAINAAYSLGRPLCVVGGNQSSDGSDPNAIVTDVPIFIPAAAKLSYRFYAITLWFRGSNDNSNLGLIFDNMDMMDFELSGQIVYPGNASAVTFWGRTPFGEGTDAFQVLTSSRIKIGSIAITEPSGAPRPSNGTALAIVGASPFTFNEIDVAEINGGIRPIWTDGQSANFSWNRIKLWGIHNNAGPGIIQGGPGPNDIVMWGPG